MFCYGIILIFFYRKFIPAKSTQLQLDIAILDFISVAEVW